MPREKFQRPEDLTVDKLKKELTKRGIKFPPKSLKAEYIRLYKEKILQTKPLASFSSDEESFAETPRVTRQNTKAQKSDLRVTLEKIDQSLTDTDMDVQNFTDEELREELKRHGIDAGPIGPTTRRLYENRLKSVLAKLSPRRMSDDDLARELARMGENVGPVGPTTRRIYERRLEKALTNGGAGDVVEQYSDAESEESEDVEVVETVVMETRRKPAHLVQQTIPKSGSATRRRPMRRGFEEQSDESADIGATEKTKEVTEEKTAPSSEPELHPPEPLKSNRSWVPVWVQIVIVLLLFALIYLVVQAMEENPIKRIPRS